jgi:putative ABC transport system ATP-binding protein
MLRAEHLTKQFTLGRRTITVLDDVSLNITRGEFLVIGGSSGSGKTTLLTLLSGLDSPSDGRILFDDTDITNLPEDDLAALRNRKIGYVFQSFHLVPSLTAMENIMFPAELAGKPDAAERAARLMGRVGMEHRQGNFPHQLSGGEKQRVAICRALVNAPDVLFADEPTGNLDSDNGAAILEMLMDAKAETGATLVLVTHSREIAGMADRVVHLKDGRLNGRQRE